MKCECKSKAKTYAKAKGSLRATQGLQKSRKKVKTASESQWKSYKKAGIAKTTKKKRKKAAFPLIKHKKGHKQGLTNVR